MLDPNYILKLSEPAERLAFDLHSEIINAVVERIAIRLGRGDNYVLTAQDKWALETLQDAGFLVEDIQKIIAKRTGLSLQTIKKAFTDAGVRAINYDNEIYRLAGLPVTPLTQSPQLLRILARGYEATAGEWVNYTRSTALSAQNIFIEECDKAYNLVLSGTMGYDQACKQAVERIAKNGIDVVYPSGHRDTIETATLRAVRTGVSQACGGITATRASENGITCFMTSSHLGARPTHEPWQGKVFWVDWDKLSQALNIPMNGGEASPEEKAKYKEFVETTEIGTVTGLCGANCRHSYMPWIEGVSHNPFEQFDSEENRREYERQQKEKAFQNKIKKQKRVVDAIKEAKSLASGKEAQEVLSETYQKEYAKLGLYREQFQTWKADAERTNSLPLAVKSGQPPVGGFVVSNQTDAQQRVDALIEDVKKYTTRKSVYNGNVTILGPDEYEGAMGIAFYDGTIGLRVGATDSNIVHELFHTFSISAYTLEDFVKCRTLEEGVVDAMAEMFFNDIGAQYIYSYRTFVDYIKKLHSYVDTDKTYREFLYELFDIDPPSRLDYLRELKYRDDLTELEVSWKNDIIFRKYLREAGRN